MKNSCKPHGARVPFLSCQLIKGSECKKKGRRIHFNVDTVKPDAVRKCNYANAQPGSDHWQIKSFPEKQICGGNGSSTKYGAESFYEKIILDMREKIFQEVQPVIR